MKDDIMLWFAVFGGIAGRLLMGVSIAWDLVPWVRGFMEFSIRGFGACGIVLGWAILELSTHYRREVEK